MRAGIDSHQLSSPLNFVRSMPFALHHREAASFSSRPRALSFVVYPSGSRPVGGSATLNVRISMPYFAHGELHHHS